MLRLSCALRHRQQRRQASADAIFLIASVNN